MGFKIAIDGPAGSGKSSLASAIAQSIGILNVNTGAIYRAYTLYMLNCNADINSENEVKNKLCEVKVNQDVDSTGASITFLNGENVTNMLGSELVSKSTAIVAKYPSVREKVAEVQRNLASKYDVVMEGRDIGSVILPDAEVKIYLTASPEIRAKRRFNQLKEKNIEVDYESVLQGIRDRDKQDTTRKISPLIKCADAIEVNTDNISLEEVENIILNIINNKRKE